MLSYRSCFARDVVNNCYPSLVRIARGTWFARLSVLAILALTLCALCDNVPDQPSISNHQGLEKGRWFHAGVEFDATICIRNETLGCLAIARSALLLEPESRVAFDTQFRWRVAGNTSPPLS
jgi:hypothetical protein